MADTLGNQTTNFTWSFQLALAPVLSTNIVFLGGTNPAPCNLTLLSTNGDYFTFSYTGSCCLTNGMQLVNTNLYTGYARTVLSFTNYPDSNTVVALTRHDHIGRTAARRDILFQHGQLIDQLGRWGDPPQGPPS